MGRMSSLEDTLEATPGGHPGGYFWRTTLEDTLKDISEDTLVGISGWRIPWRTPGGNLWRAP
jgi:hypothetical protein